jgi:hypothetical protein
VWLRSHLDFQGNCLFPDISASQSQKTISLGKDVKSGATWNARSMSTAMNRFHFQCIGNCQLGHHHGLSVLWRVTVSRFDQLFIVDKGKEVRDWGKLKAALAKESGRLRDLAGLRARPRQCPNIENDQLGDLPSLSIDAIFGLDFPAEGTFDQFTGPFKDKEMFKDTNRETIYYHWRLIA